MSYNSDYAMLAGGNGVYSQLTPGQAVGNWTVVESYNMSDGYQGALFKNQNNEYVFASRGTEPSSDSDLYADIQMGVGLLPSQLDSARAALAESISRIENSGGNVSDLTLVGHSLGGSLTQMLGAENPGLTAVTFNPYGAGNLIPDGNYSNITNNVMYFDPVSVLPGSKMVGSTYAYFGQGQEFLGDLYDFFRQYITQHPFFSPAWLSGHGIDQFMDGNIASQKGILVDIGVSKTSWIADFMLGSVINRFFAAAKAFTPRRDPLALDLDGDGLETLGITGTTQVLFDHDGDGIRTGTGWIKGDDAFLALDKNANGTIDNGNELFGVDTVLASGQKAANGFAALSDLDSNHDGAFTSADARFADLRLWRDLNQDGISQADELQSLAAAGIARINLSSTASNTNLGNGNVMSAAGTFTKTSGATGTVGEFITGSSGNLDLAQNPFYREFTDSIPLTAEAALLPGMQGAGKVRDLQEAASLNPVLVDDINGLTGTTRSQMLAGLDALIQHWADSATMPTSRDKVAALGGARLLFSVPGITSTELSLMQLEGQPGTEFITATLRQTPGFDAAHYASMLVEVERFGKMVDVLEKFNGMTFLDFPTASETLNNRQTANDWNWRVRA